MTTKKVIATSPSSQKDETGQCSSCSTARTKEAFFFFQAEDGIRDIGVTGVQTCALPISFPVAGLVACLVALGSGTLGTVYQKRHGDRIPLVWGTAVQYAAAAAVLVAVAVARSEGRRGGKECRSRWSPDRYKKKQSKLECG